MWNVSNVRMNESERKCTQFKILRKKIQWEPENSALNIKYKDRVGKKDKINKE